LILKLKGGKMKMKNLCIISVIILIFCCSWNFLFANDFRNEKSFWDYGWDYGISQDINNEKFNFGKNLIVHSSGILKPKFNWRIYKTEHIYIYFYPEEEELLPKFVYWVENVYEYLSKNLNYQIPVDERPSLFFFLNVDDFFENTIDHPATGALAFAEPMQFRVVLQKSFDEQKMIRIITHEMTHIFEFSIWYGGKVQPMRHGLMMNQALLWLFEGLSQYESQLHKQETGDLQIAAYLSLKDSIPPIEMWHRSGDYMINYVLAGWFFDYIESQYSKDVLIKVVKKLKFQPTFIGLNIVVDQIFETTFADLNLSFRNWLKNKFKNVQLKAEPLEYGKDILMTRYFNSPSKPDAIYDAELSPDGKQIAVITYKSDRLRILIIDAENGIVEKELTKGFSFYDYGVSILIDNTSHSMCWRGDNLWFFVTNTKFETTLLAVNVKNGNVVKKINIPNYFHQVSAPDVVYFKKDRYKIIFSGQIKGQRDLFLMDETGKIKNLTNDGNFDYDLRVSNDEKYVVYTKVVNGKNKLFLMNLELENKENKQLIFGNYNATRPVWSSDDQEIYFIADKVNDSFESGNVNNVFKISVKSEFVSQLTDLSSNAIYVLARNNKIYFGALGYRDYFHRFSYNLYKAKNDFNQNKIGESFHYSASSMEKQLELFSEQVTIDKSKVKDYSFRLYPEYVFFNGGFSTYYGFFGLAAFSLSDFTGSHRFWGEIINFGKGRFRYIDIGYANLSRPLRFIVNYKSTYYFFFPYDYLFYNSDTPVFSGLIQDYNNLGVTFVYPIDLVHRIEFTPSISKVNYIYDKEADELELEFINTYFNKGTFSTVTTSFIRDAVWYKSFGPMAGDRVALDAFWSPGGYNKGITIDARKYFRLSSSAVLATRGFFGKQTGKSIMPFLLGDTGELRGYNFMQFSGNQLFLFNTELRLPITETAYGGLGFLENIRLNIFVDVANIKWDKNEFNEMLNGKDGNWKGSLGLDFEFGRFNFLMLDLGNFHISLSKRISFNPLTFKKGWITNFYFAYPF